VVTEIPSLSALADFVGSPLGVSEWTTVSQERIDTFAAATGDRQWIHCDPARAERESPFGGTVAHGYLTLSLAPALLETIVSVRGATSVVNVGIDRMRLSAPVPAGSRVRLAAEIANVRNVPGGAVRVAFRLRFEVEGGARPACNATVVYLYSP
jgi:acyl dehydratase